MQETRKSTNLSRNASHLSMSERHLGLTPQPLSPFRSPQVMVQFVPCQIFGLVSTPARVQHSLQGRRIARAGFDNMWCVFTPLLRNEELKRATEHCDRSTMHLSLSTYLIAVGCRTALAGEFCLVIPPTHLFCV